MLAPSGFQNCRRPLFGLGNTDLDSPEIATSRGRALASKFQARAHIEREITMLERPFALAFAGRGTTKLLEESLMLQVCEGEWPLPFSLMITHKLVACSALPTFGEFNAKESHVPFDLSSSADSGHECQHKKCLRPQPICVRSAHPWL
jgi:hypothetical protein